MTTPPMTAEQILNGKTRMVNLFEPPSICLEEVITKKDAIEALLSFAASESRELVEEARREGMEIAWEGCGSSNCSCQLNLTNHRAKYPPVKEKS